MVGFIFDGECIHQARIPVRELNVKSGLSDFVSYGHVHDHQDP